MKQENFVFAERERERKTRNYWKETYGLKKKKKKQKVEIGKKEKK